MAEKTMTRRAFALAGVGAAGVAALAGTRAARAEEAGTQEPAWTHEADVVIVGLGGAGAAAAVEAIEAGASVLALEGSTAAGGATALSGGLIYMGGTALQAQLGVEDDAENMRAYLEKACGPASDPELLNYFVDHSAELYDWLVAHDVSFEGDVDAEHHLVVAPEGVCLNYSGNERACEYAEVATPAPRGHTPNGGGAAVIKSLMAVVEPGAEVLYETHASSLVTDADGSVVGVRAEAADGSEVLAHATKGVILTCGAYTYNDELLGNTHPYALKMGARTGIPADLGEGIVMAQRIGAATKSLGLLSIQKHFYRYGDMPFCIAVDYRGLRYMNEEGYGSWTGRDIIKVSPDKGYLIGDASTVDGIADQFGYDDVQPVAQTDTIEELAEAVELPVETLAATLEHYNEMCEAGEDTDFYKSADYLRALDTPPYYAYDNSAPTVSFHTIGGLKINASAQVIDVAGEPIPGLYAAGRTSCGIYGEYPGSGSSIADCLTFGRVAGASVAAL